MQKGKLTQCTQQIRVVGTVTFSAKRSLYPHTVGAVGTVDAVDTVDTVDIVDAVNMGGGDI